jgi:hypothetical protein
MSRHPARLALAFAALFCVPAYAQSALEHSAAPLLKAAAEKALAHAEDSYAYTVEHWSSNGEKEATVKLRYDPRLPKGARWLVLDQDEDALDKSARKALKELRKAEAKDNPVIYDKLGEMIEVAEFREETETEAVFVAQVDTEEFPKDALEVFITLDKPGAYVSRIEVRSKKPFKPMPVAKVTNLVQSQTFAAPEGDGPALIARSDMHVEGEAMFKSFKQLTRQTFSDIEKVELPAVGE